MAGIQHLLIGPLARISLRGRRKIHGHRDLAKIYTYVFIALCLPRLTCV
jgi:hypothetical protein